MIITTTIQEKNQSKTFQMQEKLDLAPIVEKTHQLPLNFSVVFERFGTKAPESEKIDDKSDKKPTLFLKVKGISCNKSSNLDENESRFYKIEISLIKF